MNRPNITPGPWKTRRLEGFPLQIATVPDSDGFGKPLADCGEYQPHNEANARAIAAVPALLEALEGVLLFLEQGMKYSDFGSAGNEVLDIRTALIAAGYQF